MKKQGKFQLHTFVNETIGSAIRQRQIHNTPPANLITPLRSTELAKLDLMFVLYKM